MKNGVAVFGFFFETILIAILAYVPFLNDGLGTRMVASAHFMILSFPYFAIIFFYDEARKALLRSGINKQTGRYEGWVVQNTLY